MNDRQFDEVFGEDLKDSVFVKGVKREVAKLNSAVAVRAERESYGWSQAELASKAGVPQSTVARIERGDNTSIEMMSKLAEAFGKEVQISFS